jgi:cytochrome c oxidase subunit I+III
MPRRVYTYDPSLGVNGLNLSATIFAFVMGLGIILVIIDFMRHFRRGPAAGKNPWGAPSLEWLSANAELGFRSLPVIDSRYPVWESENLAHEIESGRGYLPDAPTIERESLMTAPLTGEPEQILRLPGPSWVPFLAAATTAIFFTALTLKLTWIGLFSGAAALTLLLYWLWNLEGVPEGIGRCRSRPRATAVHQ